MLFNSYLFILFFLPLSVAGYFILNHLRQERLAKVYLLGMSFWFYGYYHVAYMALMGCSILGNYSLAAMIRKQEQPHKKKHMTAFAVLANLGVLFYFKYMDFFIRNLNGLLHTDVPLLHIALPLGISFFTFQQISFVLDTYRGEVPQYDLLDYAVYVSFFPQLVAGPIVTHDKLIPQIRDPRNKHVNWSNLSRGIYLFTLGLFKKVMLADSFGQAVDFGWKYMDTINSLDAVLVMIGYTFQIYLDFSGYCDMALGIGKMLNIELPENFRSPYQAKTITEFWERWHITLTSFFTKYLYIPLGGNRKGTLRTYCNMMLVFLASGLWHGADWSFVAWGGLHGLFMVVTRHFKKVVDRIPPVLNWMITMTFVCVTWVLFRADSIGECIKMFQIIGQRDFGEVNINLIAPFQMAEFTKIFDKLSFVRNAPVLYLVFFYVGTFLMILFGRNAHEKMKHFQPTAFGLITTLTLLIWSIFSLSGVNIFIYFNF